MRFCRSRRGWVVLCAALVLAALIAPAHPVRATTSHVTNCGSSGPGSLPFLVTTAASGDTILFDLDCPPESPIMLNGTIGITKDLTIDGIGHSVAISGNGAVKVFAIGGFSGGFTVSFNALTLENGYDAGASAMFIYNSTVTLTNCTVIGNTATLYSAAIHDNGGVLTLRNSTISGNTMVGGMGSSGRGGAIGISTNGIVNLINSTISGNAAHDSTGFGSTTPGTGGAIFNDRSTVILTNSTISGNSANIGGGIYNNSGTVVATDTIIAGNNAPTDPDVIGVFSGNAHNLIGNTTGSAGFGGTDVLNVNPQLGPLANNGGPTQTMALLPGSPAYNAGGVTCPSGVTTDQRGISRPFYGACDIGAFEVAFGLTGVSPASGSSLGGNMLTLSGILLPLDATVTIGGNPAVVTNHTASAIIVIAPAHAPGTVDVAIMSGGNTATLASGYTYVTPAPPIPRPGGTVVGTPNPLPTPVPPGITPTPGSPDPHPPSRP